MKEEDFIEVTPKHIKSIRKIVKNEGDCDYVYCKDCPLCSKNTINNKNCSDNFPNTLEYCKQFLELFDKPKEKSLNFYERLSATIFKKQVLFKQDDGTYYNQRLDENMSKSDVKEWLLDEIGEMNKDDN